MGTPEPQWGITGAAPALIVGFVGVVSAVVVPVTHELPGNADRIGALKLVGAATATVRVVLTVYLVSGVQTVASSVAPFVFGDACPIFALFHPLGTFSLYIRG
jgi:hypothetical protein